MTHDPPNWQWCQGCSPEDRIKYKQQVDKKHKRNTYDGKAGDYKTVEDMLEVCRNVILPILHKNKVRGIAGVPRSGCVVSSYCAVNMNIPLYSISNNSIQLENTMSDFGGQRMGFYNHEEGKIAVIDDTVFSGLSMKDIKNNLGDDYLYGCVYARPESKHILDFYGEELESPHILDWNFYNSNHIKHTLFDFDGIFSPDVPVPVCEDEELYIDYITNVRPYFHRLPLMHKIQGIVTARLEKYRKETEEWLDRYGVRYNELVMFPTEREAERDANHTLVSASYKAKVYSSSDAKFFVESNPMEASFIRKISKRLVICPEQGVFA
jgi:uncharacterized HAD superfamily protein